MTQKNIVLSVGAVVAVAVAGYFFFGAPATPEPVVPNTDTSAQNTGEPSSAQGKIDINAVCEGALAYMTFTDGQSAAAFVAECKEGKHPEVIEHYKAQMGLGEGAAI